jgi:hypothetical protein
MDDLPTQVESLQGQMAMLQAHLTSLLWITTILSFAFALACAYVAGRRGHNVFRWATLGAMLAKVATKICPDCAESVKAEAAKCRFCGYRFDEAEIVPRIT